MTPPPRRDEVLKSHTHKGQTLVSDAARVLRTLTGPTPEDTHRSTRQALAQLLDVLMRRGLITAADLDAILLAAVDRADA